MTLLVQNLIGQKYSENKKNKRKKKRFYVTLSFFLIVYLHKDKN